MSLSHIPFQVDDVQPSGITGSKPPIYFKTKDNDGLIRILLTEQWYDALKPIYDCFKWASAIVSVDKFPTNLEAAGELFEYLVVEFGAVGWVFTFSIFALLKWAAEHAISLGKFAYKKVGRPVTLGRPIPGTLGGKLPSTLGRSMQIVELTK